MAEGVRVAVAGRETPVVLKELPPPTTERAVATFEARIGFALPADYREFLLRYNGGSPVVGWVNGRDDDPDVPYAHGDSVRGFYGLGDDVPSCARLLVPSEIDWIDWEMPPLTLFVGDDEGGNQLSRGSQGPSGRP